MSKKKGESGYSLNIGIFVLLAFIALVIFAVARMWGTKPSGGAVEINNIVAVLEVLVAVLAIMGFELLLQVHSAIQQVNKFDERIDKIEIKLSELPDFSEYLTILETECTVMEHLELSYRYIKSRAQELQFGDYRDGLEVLFSELERLAAYGRQLFQLYFSDETQEIDEEKHRKVFDAIEVFAATIPPDYSDFSCRMLSLRLKVATRRIDAWRGRLSRESGTMTSDLRIFINKKLKYEKQIAEHIKRKMHQIKCGTIYWV